MPDLDVRITSMYPPGVQQSVEHWLKRNQNKEKSWRR